MDMIFLAVLIIVAFNVFRSNYNKNVKKKRIEEEGVYGSTRVSHIQGFDFPPGIRFSTVLYEDFLMFTYEKNNIKLSLNKIRDVSAHSASQIKSGSLSVKNAFVGGALLGEAGAIIGGVTGKATLDYRYLVISYYTDENELKYIILKGTYGNANDAKTVEIINRHFLEFVNDLKMRVNEVSNHTEVIMQEL